MPVTQRWVHGGLVLAMVVFSMSLTVLVLGATRKPIPNAGLPGAMAASFQLKNSLDEPVAYTKADEKLSVLIFVPHYNPDFAKYAHIVTGVVDAYGQDKNLHLVGVAFQLEATLFGPNATLPSVLEQRCPGLKTGLDRDGEVARAYRVSDAPTLFVIDPNGLIKHRIELNQDGAGIAVSETLRSLLGNSMNLQPLLSDSRRL